MLDWLKAYEKEQGSEPLHVNSGGQTFAAHKFYLREGSSITSYRFAIGLDL